MLRPVGEWMLSVLLLAAWAGLAVGQPPAPGTVSSTGVVTIQPTPTHLRMHAQLQARGTNVEQALERLKTRRKDATAKLTALKADPNAIVFGKANVSRIGPVWGPSTYPPASVTPQYVPGPSYSAPSYSPYGPPPPPATLVPIPAPSDSVPPPTVVPRSTFEPTPAPPSFAVPPPQPPVAVPPDSPTAPPIILPSPRPANKRPAQLVVASMTLTAQWPLEAAGTDEMLAAARRLEEKIIAADVTGGNTPDKLSPAEQELVEEGIVPMPAGPPTLSAVPYAVPQNGPYYPAPSGGEVIEQRAAPFVYVARLTDPQRKKALADAFAQAKSRAAELAEAAGARLGPLASLSGDASSAGAAMYVPPSEVNAATACNENEAVSPSADGLGFTIRVYASFHLLPARTE
jgi:uncharacterized protein YggE